MVMKANFTTVYEMFPEKHKHPSTSVKSDTNEKNKEAVIAK